MTSLPERLLRALERTGKPSSDYDLNPGFALPENRKLRPAAVLLPIVDQPGGAQIILTKRSSALRHHPGQIAFPGGKVDDGDAGVMEAAIREAAEEIGLNPETTSVLGTLPEHETVTGFKVTPVLSLVSPSFVPVPGESEVAEVFEAPFAHVMEATNYSVQSRRWRGQRRFYFAVPWGPYYIWGATARILRALADRMADDQD